MVSLPPAGGTGKKINGASLFGKDRYAQYINEMNSQGTIEGIPLTKSERKEGFKSRDTKLNFEKFVGRIFSKKTSTPKSKVDGESSGLIPGQKLLMGRNTKFSSKPFSAPDIPEPETEPATQTQSQDASKKEDFEGVGDKIDELIAEIRAENKADRADAEKERKRLEDEKRAKKEEMKEKIKSFIAAPITKALAPVTNIFKKIWDGLKTILFAKVLMKLVDWFSDPQNKGKIESIGKFIKDFWPAIVAGFLLFGTGLGGLATWFLGTGVKLIGSLVGLVAKLAVAAAKLGWGAAKWAARNPLAAALIVIGGWGISKILGSQLDKEEKDGENEFRNLQKEDPQNKDRPPDESDTYTKEQKQTLELKRQMEDRQEFNKGGTVPGSGNKDTVPAMLTPGEFVMSKGAVQKYGSDTLAGMNAAAGGTNIPVLMPDKKRKGFPGGGEPYTPAVSTDNVSGGAQSGTSNQDMGDEPFERADIVDGIPYTYLQGLQTRIIRYKWATDAAMQSEEGSRAKRKHAMMTRGLIKYRDNNPKVVAELSEDDKKLINLLGKSDPLPTQTPTPTPTQTPTEEVDKIQGFSGGGLVKVKGSGDGSTGKLTMHDEKGKQQGGSYNVISGLPGKGDATQEERTNIFGKGLPMPDGVYGLSGFEEKKGGWKGLPGLGDWSTFIDGEKGIGKVGKRTGLMLHSDIDPFGTLGCIGVALGGKPGSKAEKAFLEAYTAANPTRISVQLGGPTGKGEEGDGRTKSPDNTLNVSSTETKGGLNAQAIMGGVKKAGQAVLQSLPLFFPTSSPPPSPSGGSGVPNLGSVDPQNSSLWVLKAMYNVGT